MLRNLSLIRKLLYIEYKLYIFATSVFVKKRSKVDIMFLIIFLKGFLMGLLGSVPLGPIGVICIQRTLGKGRLSGFVSGLGASSADTFIAFVATFGLTFIFNFIEQQKNIFQLVGGIFIIAAGVRIFYANPVQQIRDKDVERTLSRDFFSVLMFTLSNPLSILIFPALIAGLGLVSNSKDYLHNISLVLGVYIGASLWWFTLSSFVSVYRNKIKIKNLWWLNKITGTIIFLFGLIAIITIFYSKIPVGITVH